MVFFPAEVPFLWYIISTIFTSILTRYAFVFLSHPPFNFLIFDYLFSLLLYPKYALPIVGSHESHVAISI